MVEQHAKTPAEFVRDMPDDDPSAGSGAGPGAPETAEPRTGRPGNAGHGPAGERDAAPESWVKPADPRVEPRDSNLDSQPDAMGMLGTAWYSAQRTVLKLLPGGRRHG